MKRMCSLTMFVDGEKRRVGSYAFDEFEPQVGDILRDVLSDEWNVGVMICGRDWEDGELTLEVRDDYRVIDWAH